MSTDNSVVAGEGEDSESNRMSPVTPGSYLNDPAFYEMKNDEANESSLLKGNNALVSI